MSSIDATGRRDVIKVTDLELSQVTEDDDAAHQAPGEGGFDNTHTVNWTAPEVISEGKPRYTKAADCYSLGMVLWELLTGQVPFDEPDIGPSDVPDLVTKQKYRPPIPADTPPEYADLVRQAWDHEPTQRPSAAKIADELLLMRRRWRVNRTLQSGRFLTSEEDAGQTASEESFVNARFQPEIGRTGPMPGSGSDYNMGSLSGLAELESGDKPVLSPRRKSGHRRALSEGSALRRVDPLPLGLALPDSEGSSSRGGGGGGGGGAAASPKGSGKAKATTTTTTTTTTTATATANAAGAAAPSTPAHNPSVTANAAFSVSGTSPNDDHAVQSRVRANESRYGGAAKDDDMEESYG